MIVKEFQLKLRCLKGILKCVFKRQILLFYITITLIEFYLNIFFSSRLLSLYLIIFSLWYVFLLRGDFHDGIAIQKWFFRVLLRIDLRVINRLVLRNLSITWWSYIILAYFNRLKELLINRISWLFDNLNQNLKGFLGQNLFQHIFKVNIFVYQSTLN